MGSNKKGLKVVIFRQKRRLNRGSMKSTISTLEKVRYRRYVMTLIELIMYLITSLCRPNSTVLHWLLFGTEAIRDVQVL